jgi:hypothetical protein
MTDPADAEAAPNGISLSVLASARIAAGDVDHGALRAL